MYWILSNELVDEDEDADLTGDFSTDLGENIRFDNGELINDTPKSCTYTLTEKLQGNLTDNLSIDEISGLVWSNRLCDLAEELKITNLQFFDLKIIDPFTGNSYSDYKVVNIVGAVDCIDFEESELEFYDDGDVEFIDKLALDEEKIPLDMDIFRLEKDMTDVVLSDKLKKAIDYNDITGCALYRVDKYQM